MNATRYDGEDVERFVRHGLGLAEGLLGRIGVGANNIQWDELHILDYTEKEVQSVMRWVDRHKPWPIGKVTRIDKESWMAPAPSRLQVRLTAPEWLWPRGTTEMVFSLASCELPGYRLQELGWVLLSGMPFWEGELNRAVFHALPLGWGRDRGLGEDWRSGARMTHELTREAVSDLLGAEFESRPIRFKNLEVEDT